MSEKNLSEKLLKFSSVEINKTYKEFSTVKLLTYGVLSIAIASATISIGINSGVYRYAIIPIGIGASLVTLWQGMKWMFPRYMILSYTIDKVKNYKKSIPKFKGF